MRHFIFSYSGLIYKLTIYILNPIALTILRCELQAHPLLALSRHSPKRLKATKFETLKALRLLNF